MLTHRALKRPSGGSAQWATRHGCRVSRARTGMADRGGPTEQDRSEGMPSLSEAPNDRGKKRFGYFPPGRAGFSKVTRCKSETNSRRDRRNGYVHQTRKEVSHRRRPRSHKECLVKMEKARCDGGRSGPFRFTRPSGSGACEAIGKKSAATRPGLWQRRSGCRCAGSTHRTAPDARRGSCSLQGCPLA